MSISTRRERELSLDEAAPGELALPSVDYVQSDSLERVRAARASAAAAAAASAAAAAASTLAAAEPAPPAVDASGALRVPRRAYAAVVAVLPSRPVFLAALRAFHAQLAAAPGAAPSPGVPPDGLLRGPPGAPEVDAFELFRAVAAAGGAGALADSDPAWRRVALVPGVLAASRAALGDTSALPTHVRRVHAGALAGFEIVYAARAAAELAAAGAGAGAR